MRRKYVIAPQMLPNKKIIEEMDKSWKTEDRCSGFFFVVKILWKIYDAYLSVGKPACR